MGEGTKCVECGGHVPVYQNFFCEECYREILNDKYQTRMDKYKEWRDKDKV